MFLTVEHVFRYATEYGTRDAFDTPFWPGYFDSVQSLHGWADGDPFLVNYVGHPMQGAVAGFIWQHNDRAYRDRGIRQEQPILERKAPRSGILVPLQRAVRNRSDQ